MPPEGGTLNTISSSPQLIVPAVGTGVTLPAFIRSIIHCGYRAAGAVVRESSSISSGDSSRSAAFRLSSSCDILFAPMMIEVTPACVSNQAKAT